MNTQAFEGVIFDVDGVLLNTVPYHFKAWRQLFRENGIRFTFKDYILKVNGLPRKTGIINMMPKLTMADIEKLSNRKQTYFMDIVLTNPPKPLPGVIRLLKTLKTHGVKTAAASSSKNAPLLLSRSLLSSYFDAIVGGEEITKSKPDPQLFILACAKLHIKPQACIVIEDATIGIIAAKSANMKTIGVLTSNDTALQKSADLTIKSLRNIKTIMSFINQ